MFFSRLSALIRSLRWYGMALALVAAVVAVELAAAPSLRGGAPAMMVVAVVLVSAAAGGLGPGLVTASLATAITEALRLSAHQTPRPPLAIVVEGLAFAIQSLGAAALMASLRSSQLRARASARHIGAAYEMSAALGEATSPREVADAILRHGIIAFETELAAVYLAEDGPDGKVLRILAHVERDPHLVRFLPPFEALGFDSDLPPAIAARTRSPVSAANKRESAARYPALAPLVKQGLPPAFMCAPMLIDERLVGVLAAAYANEEEYRAVDMGWSIGLARECAVAIERTRMIENLRHARVEAQAATHAKDEFVATLSRALREPLSEIERGARVLEEGAWARRLWDEGIDLVSHSLQTEQRVVDDLLDLARIAASDLPLTKGPVDFTRLVRSCVDEARAMAATSGIDLTPSVRARAVVIGDGERLRRVVRELLRNALRSTSPDGHVRLDLEASDGRTRLRVSDDGRGIAAADLPHVFEPFQRTRDPRQGARLGIGLAISKYVADRHGGAMHVESPGEGRGAVFTLELPLAAGR